MSIKLNGSPPSELLLSSLATFLGALASVLLLGAAQRPPDLSGDWALVSATTSGGRGGRPGPGETGERRVSTNTVSGAPFNCGRACKIVHKGQTLIIESAYLASSPTPASDVTLQLDSREALVVDSFNPTRQLPAKAEWSGDDLKITSSVDKVTIAQIVSLKANQLVVVTSFNTDGAAPLTLRYKRK
jgi:hypothetical protein